MKEIIGLQYLRGFAALLVVLYHAMPTFVKQSVPEFAYEWMAGGVDVFFVISGYIIWLTTEKPGVRPWPWWRTRLIRIVPLYWICLVAMLILLFYRETAMPGAEEIVRSFLFIPGMNSQLNEPAPILVPGWTLYYEFFFYATMALLLFLPNKLVRLGLLCVFFVTLVALRAVADERDPIQFRYTSPLLLEFVAGIFIALTTRHIDAYRIKHLLGGVSLVASLGFLVFVSPLLYPTARTLYLGIPAVLLVFGVVCFEDVLRRRVIVPLKVLGDSSYSLYLSHTMVLQLGSMIFFTVLGLEGEGPRFLFRVPVCVAFGLLLFYTVERPLLRWMKGKRTDRSPGTAEPQALQ